MGRRGPKSAASQNIAQVTKPVDQYQPPPARLNAAGKRRWRELVAGHPPERFSDSDTSLLADMIVSEQYIAKCDKELQKLRSHLTEEGKIHPLVGLRDTHIKAQVLLQRALRLCPSMRMRHDKAGLGGTKTKKKPWDDE